MRILVTGGAGFIGSHVVDTFVEAGHDVFVIDNLSSGRKEFINPKAKFFNVDITDRGQVAKVIKEVKPNVVNHHAAQISVRISVQDPTIDARINIVGLLNLLEEARLHGTSSFIFASSGGVVYGDASTLPTPEDYHPLAPLSPYGVSKLASEHYLNFYYQTYGIKFVALRYSNVYGPRQNPYGEAGVVAIFSKKLLSGQVCTINGDGRQTRDYVYVADVALANLAAVHSPFVGAVNIGTNVETDVVILYENLAQVVGSELKPVYGPVKIGEQKRSCLKISKALQVLRWKPEITLSEGLKTTVSYFQNHE